MVRSMARPPVLFLAHRGASTVAPENTIPAFRKAMTVFRDAGRSLGGRIHQGVEFDIQFPRPEAGQRQEIVIFHDDDLGRTSDVPRALASRSTGKPPAFVDLTLSEMRLLDVGAWFSEEFVGTRVPLFREVLEAVTPETVLDIEFKRNFHSTKSDGSEDHLLEYLQACKVTQPFFIHSFDGGFLTRLRERARLRGWPGNLQIGQAFWAKDKAERDEWLPRLNPDILFLQHHEGMGAEIEASHRVGRKVYIWTLNSVAEIVRAVEAGADAVLSDRPELLVDPAMPRHVAERFLVP